VVNLEGSMRRELTWRRTIADQPSPKKKTLETLVDPGGAPPAADREEMIIG